MAEKEKDWRKDVHVKVVALTERTRTLLTAASVPPPEFVRLQTDVLNGLLDLKLERNRRIADKTASTATAYHEARYDNDEPAGHMEARQIATGKMCDREKSVDDLKSFISHLKGLLDLMNSFEKMTRY